MALAAPVLAVLHLQSSLLLVYWGREQIMCQVLGSQRSRQQTETEFLTPGFTTARPGWCVVNQQWNISLFLSVSPSQINKQMFKKEKKLNYPDS